VPVLARRKTDTSEIHGTPGFCFKCNQPALVEEGLDLEPNVLNPVEEFPRIACFSPVRDKAQSYMEE